MSRTLKQYKRMLKVAYVSTMDGSGYAVRKPKFLLGDTAYMVVTAPIAKNDEEAGFITGIPMGNRIPAYNEQGQVQFRFNGHEVEYAYYDEDKYVFFIVAGNNGWLSTLRDNGYFVKDMGKVVKRLKAFNRPTVLGAEFTAPLNIEIVADNAYVDPGFEEKLTSYIQGLPEHLRLPREDYYVMLLDGWIALNPKVVGEMIRQSEFHTDHMKGKLQLDRSNKASQYNIRYDDPNIGTAKGNGTVGRGMGLIDMRMAASAVKEEITSSDRTQLIGEPQEGKNSVRMNNQYRSGLPPLGTVKFKQEILKDMEAHIKKDIIEGKLLHSFSDVNSLRWDRIKKAGNWQDGLAATAAYAAIEYAMLGGDYRKSPFLVERGARSKVENLIDGKGNVRIPIPCAFHEQVISQSAARMAGHHITVPEGYYYRLTSIGVTVVNDMDWIRNYHNWGTPDFDDFFDGIERTLDGVKGAIFVRPPHELGGWVFLKHMEGQPVTEWKKADGSVTTFPKISGKYLPKQITTKLIDGSLVYTGLPSATAPKVGYDGTSEYSYDTFKGEVLSSINNSGVGTCINPRQLHSEVFRNEKVSTFICSLNDMVDVFVQAGAKDDRVMLGAEADKLMEKILASGRKIDQYTWETRFAPFYTGDVEPNLYEGPTTKEYNMVRDFQARVIKWAQDWGQKNTAAPSEIVHTLGGRNISMKPLNRVDKVMEQPIRDGYQKAASLLRKHRSDTARANEAIQEAQINADRYGTTGPDSKINPDTWVRLMQPIMDEINIREGVDRHTFVMGFISAVYTIKTTTTNRWSDAPLWSNRTTPEGINIGLFRYVVEALQHFGILANELTITDTGELVRSYITTWELACSSCGKVYIIPNAVSYQRYMQTALVCKDCQS